MHRNVWQYLFSVSPEKCALKLTPKRDEEEEKYRLHCEEPRPGTVRFLGDEKAFTEGSRSNGFKSDQKSHNNQNLLNDLLVGFMD